MISTRFKATSIGAVAGVAGAAYLYGVLAGPMTIPTTMTTSLSTPAVTNYRDCAPPAVLDAGVCVTHLTRVVPAAAVAVPPTTSSARAVASSAHADPALPVAPAVTTRHTEDDHESDDD